MQSTTSLRGGLSGLQPRAPRRIARNVQCTAAPVKEVLEEGSKAFKTEIPAGLNKYSGHITQPKSQGASQAMLYATGLKPDDMSKPQVGSDGGARV